MKTLTELDAAIIAEEQGWEYLPACDEAELLLADLEQAEPTTTTPVPQGTTTVAMIMVNGYQNWYRINAYTGRDGMIYYRRKQASGKTNARPKLWGKDRTGIITLPGKLTHQQAKKLANKLTNYDPKTGFYTLP